MRSLSRARECARACRQKIRLDNAELFEWLQEYLPKEHDVELTRVEPIFLQGGKAEVCPAEGCLYYNKELDADPAQRLFVILHELGHLELHDRLKRNCVEPDPIYSAMYSTTETAAIARYNRRSQEEAEANAFATEFLCPSDILFLHWQADSHNDSVTLAKEFAVPVHVVHAQLAEALQRLVLGGEDAQAKAARPEFECDDSQKLAAMRIGKPVLINAGPGTGKTATLIRRIEYLLKDRNAAPENMLVLTFSNEAADELSERIAVKFGEQVAANLTVSTFHGFGVAFLWQHGQFADVDANAYILDEAAQQELVTEILAQVECGELLNIKRPAETIRELVRHINHLKNYHLYTPDDFATHLAAWLPAPQERKNWRAAQEFAALFRAYETEKAQRKRLDFADLIALPIQILNKQAGVLQAQRERYRWVMVDEYQDVSRSVARLLRLLSGDANPPWVVGDKRQSIFRFLGAAPENLDEFDNDFPGAERLELKVNYRSCQEVVNTANQLACLMENPKADSSRPDNRWTVADANPTSLTATPIAVAKADSDHAEYEGIANQIKSWLADGIAEKDIVVLARRNIDVRKIVLALGKAKIKAITSGLVTSEGAAGDLANVATYADRPRTALPRLAYTLGRARFNLEVIRATVARALETLDTDGKFAVDCYEGGQALADELQRASKALLAQKYSADAFTKMCVLLFDASAYLRRVLALEDEVERSLILEEVIATLARAASWRLIHPKYKPRISRKGFAEFFRFSLSSTATTLLPARLKGDAVRVMTCHAAKGLEFPCVIVAGQTLSKARQDYPWLPIALQPPAEDNIRQSDSLFFVGATRAKRALMVSSALTASGTKRARQRDVTPLLEYWSRNDSIHQVPFPPKLVERDNVQLGKIWGGKLAKAVPARALDKADCAIRTYVTDFLNLRFPLNQPPLYPKFIQCVRQSLGQIVRLAHERSASIVGVEAEALFLDQWAIAGNEAHPHQPIYRKLGLAYVERFAVAYSPRHQVVEHLDLEYEHQPDGLRLQLDLFGLYRTTNDTLIALSFRPDSFADAVKDGGLPWGKLKEAHRASFILLKERYAQLKVSVYSGADGCIYPFQWPQQDRYYHAQRDSNLAKLSALAQTNFVEEIDDWKCDNLCEHRISCPHWIEA